MSTENNNQTNNDSEWRQREMGALWKKAGRSQTYLSGQVKMKMPDGSEEMVRCLVFENKNNFFFFFNNKILLLSEKSIFAF